VILEAVELRVVRLPLVVPFRTSQAAQDERVALLVRAITTDGDGWADCGVSPEPFYEPEFLTGARAVLAEYLVPMLRAAGPELAAARVQPLLAQVKGHQMAKAALETAILDAELRAAGLPLARYLGAVAGRVPAGVSVGIPGSLGELLDQVTGYAEEGYRRIKLKIEPGWDIEPVRAVRERFGDIGLQVDANTAYSLADVGTQGVRALFCSNSFAVYRRQAIVEMDQLFLFLMSVSNGSVLAVIAESSCDVGLIGYEMAMLVSRTEATLTPQLIAEMRNMLPVDGATRSPVG